MSDLSLDSPLDGVHGNHEPVLARLAGQTDSQASIQAMSCAFTRLGSARATRVKAWRNWRACLTWALARNALGQLLPMPTATLRGMLWGFITMGNTHATLKSIVDAVIARHHEAHLPSPVSGNLAYQRLTGCLARDLGTQHPHKMGVTRGMVVRLLRARHPDLLSFRNSLVMCTLCMRFGRAADPALDINHQLGLFMDLAGTRPRPGCTKSSRPGAQCPVCPPL